MYLIATLHTQFRHTRHVSSAADNIGHPQPWISSFHNYDRKPALDQKKDQNELLKSQCDWLRPLSWSDLSDGLQFWPKWRVTGLIRSSPTPNTTMAQQSTTKFATCTQSLVCSFAANITCRHFLPVSEDRLNNTREFDPSTGKRTGKRLADSWVLVPEVHSLLFSISLSAATWEIEPLQEGYVVCAESGHSWAQVHRDLSKRRPQDSQRIRNCLGLPDARGCSCEYPYANVCPEFRWICGFEWLDVYLRAGGWMLLSLLWLDTHSVNLLSWMALSFALPLIYLLCHSPALPVSILSYTISLPLFPRVFVRSICLYYILGDRLFQIQPKSFINHKFGRIILRLSWFVIAFMNHFHNSMHTT